MSSHNIDDDEALARKLQEKYELERRQRRAERQRKSAASTPFIAKTTMAEPSSHARERSTHRRAASPTPERNRHARASSKPRTPANAPDESPERSRHARASSKPRTPANASDESPEHSRYARASSKPRASANASDASPERSRHARASSKPRASGNASDELPERSRHARASSMPRASVNDTTASDEALARILQEELVAEKRNGASRHTRPAANSQVERSRHTRKTVAAISAVVPSAPESYEFDTEDTTAADEAYARKLQEEMNKRAERSAHARTLKSTALRGRSNSPTRAAGKEKNTHHRYVITGTAVGTAATDIASRPLDPPAATSNPSVNPASPAAAEIRASTEGDESLARKLEQEMKDEELARRLSEGETRRRRRSSYLARKSITQKNTGDSLDGEIVLEHDIVGPYTLENFEVKRSTSRGRSRPRTRGRSKDMSRSRSPKPDSTLRKSGVAYFGVGATTTAALGLDSLQRPEQATGAYHKGVTVESEDDMSDVDVDVELALKLEQEDHDAALARKLAQEGPRRIAVFHVEADETGNRQKWTCRRFMSFAVPVVIIVAAVLGLVFAFTGFGGGSTISGGSNPVEENGDPFKGITPSDANRWSNVGKGLTLEILNALDSQWDANFDLAVSQWDSGTPDALTLSSIKVAVDRDCTPVQGKIKVCNGDYGQTPWRGINQVLLTNGYITSSVAKLNEFYLATADAAQRQYTMCHEMGHGFGLPHTDENFYNKDLGNCMDYTTNPQVNMQPDASNYLFLFDLYGLVTRRFLDNLVMDRLRDFSDEIKAAVASLDPRKDCKPLHQGIYAEDYLCDFGDNITTMKVSMLLE